MMELGASKPWYRAVETLTGRAQMSTDAFKEYFQPLERWLKEENRKNGAKVGWTVKDIEPYCNSAVSGSTTLVLTILILHFILIIS